MIVSVDAASAVPPYEQVREQLETLIASAALEPGTTLPPIRQLAGDLGLAAGTVARAYRELETAGLVVTRRRHGTHVADAVALRLTQAERRRRLRDAAETFARAAQQLGVTPDGALGAAKAAIVAHRDSLGARGGFEPKPLANR